MTHILQIHRPVKGTVNVVTGHNFAAEVKRHPNALFIVDEADAYLENHFISFEENVINGVYALDQEFVLFCSATLNLAEKKLLTELQEVPPSSILVAPTA